MCLLRELHLLLYIIRCSVNANLKFKGLNTFNCAVLTVPALSLTFKVFDDASKTVTMCSNQNSLSLFYLRNNLFIPERQSPGDCVLETFTAGQLVLCQVGITPVLQGTKESVQQILF